MRVGTYAVVVAAGCLAQGLIGLATCQGAYIDDILAHPDLISTWRLGEPDGSTIAVEETGVNGNANDGAYTAFPGGSLGQPGALPFDANTAVSFNGSSYVNAGNDTSLNPVAPSGFTVLAWVNPTATGLTGPRMVAGKWAQNATNDHFGLFLVNGVLVYAVGDGSTGEGGTVGATALSPNEWTMVAATWDAATQDYKLYVNGVQDGATGNQTGNGINTASTTPFNIGAENNSTRFFDGLIDEVALFSDALTAGEVLALYNEAFIEPAIIPEPATAILVGLGALGLGFSRRRARG